MPPKPILINDEDQLIHFQTLKNHSNNYTFILVGPQNATFSGTIYVQFEAEQNTQQEDVHSIAANLKDNKGNGDNCTLQPPQEAPESQLNQAEDKDRATSAHHCFQSDIANKFFLKSSKIQDNAVIDLLDSEEAPKVSPIRSSLFEYSLPICLADRRQYTPTFVLRNSSVSEEAYRSQFLNKLRDYRREVPRDQLMESRPKSKYQYCAICKQNYEQYLGHVSSKQHSDNYQKNKFTRHLTSLEFTLNTGIFRQMKEKELKKISKDTKKKQKPNNSNSKETSQSFLQPFESQSEKEKEQPTRKRGHRKRMSRSREKRGRGRPRGSKLKYGVENLSHSSQGSDSDSS